MDRKATELARHRDAVVNDHAIFLGTHKNVRLSFWGFKMYQECPQKYIMAAVGRRKEVKKDNFWSISGSVVHSLLEDGIKAIKEGSLSWNELPSFQQDHVRGYYDRFVDENFIDWREQNITLEEHRTSVLPAIRTSVDRSTSLLYAEGLLPHDPDKIHSEFTFVTDVADGAIQLAGRSDLVFEYPDKLIVIDPKDVADSSKVDWRQLVWYSFGLEPVFNKPVEKAAFMLTKIGRMSWRNPNAKHRGDAEGRTSREVLWAQILETVTKIRRENFPAKVNRHTCHYCPVKHECPEWYSYAGQTTSILRQLEGVLEGTTSF